MAVRSADTEASTGPTRVRSSRVPLVDGWHEVSGLVGSMSQLTPMDLVQLLMQGQRTAQVELRTPSTRAFIGVDRGQVRCCRIDGAGAGVEAFFALAFWNTGVFRVSYQRPCDEINIGIDTNLLLLEAACRHDEDHRHAPVADLLAGALAELDKLEPAPEVEFDDLPLLVEPVAFTPSGLFQSFFLEAGQPVTQPPQSPTRMPFMSTTIDIDDALDQEIVDDVDGNRTARERPRR
jgi:Domain of unknown function (DUF4388)